MSKSTILIIDDDKNNITILSQYLETQQELSLNVLVAKNGKQGIEITEAHHPDLILLDIMMPGAIKGFEVCHMLKANEATHDIPILFMTALTETSNKLKAFQLGGVDYITKPIQFEELLARLTTHLLIRKQQQELNRLLNNEIRHRENLEQAREKTHVLLQQAIQSQNNTSPNIDYYETKLQECQTKLKTFVHTVSNELNPPIESLITHCTWLEENCSPNKPLLSTESIDTIQKLKKIGIQSGNLMASLLCLAELFEEKQANVALLDMSEIVNRVVEKRLAFRIQKYQAKIKLAEIWPSVPGVRLWLEEIWFNYISHALKSAGQAPHLEIGVTPLPPDFVRFWVRNNGEAITSEEKNRLFKPFDLQGLEITEAGLGLSIVQHFVKQLGGTVGVENTTNEGNLFYFILPAY
jgi:two-component system, sensor histidine kinase and response regulator